ncbi:MAG: ribosome-associated translation inhibitor RaiA [Spirochaetota bacterium]
MNIDIKSVHFEISDELKDFIDKKLHRIDYAKDLIVDLLLTLTKEKMRYKLEANINFRWNYSSHIKVTSFDQFEGIDKFIDKLERKIRKEKDKIKDHSAAKGIV